MTTAVGPNEARSQGWDVASVRAPATRMRIAEIAAPHAASLAISRVRPRHVLAAVRRCAVGAGATIRVGPVTAGVGTVGVLMVSAGAVAATRGSPLKRRWRSRGRHEIGHDSSHIGTACVGLPATDDYQRRVTSSGSMSFLVIARERYPLRIGETMLGGRGAGSVNAPALTGLPLFPA